MPLYSLRLHAAVILSTDMCVCVCVCVCVACVCVCVTHWFSILGASCIFSSLGPLRVEEFCFHAFLFLRRSRYKTWIRSRFARTGRMSPTMSPWLQSNSRAFAGRVTSTRYQVVKMRRSFVGGRDRVSVFFESRLDVSQTDLKMLGSCTR
jgi:hypothetical protein